MRRETPLLSACLMLLAAAAVTLGVGAQPGRGAYPATLYVPNNGAQYVFQPPPGWNRVQATTVGLGTWLHPGDAGYSQSVSARATQFNGSLSELVKQVVDHLKSAYPDVRIGATQHTTVCGGHPATYLTYAFTAKTTDKRALVGEQILTKYGSTAYAATYTRAADQPSNSFARNSLTTLCGGNPPSGASTASPSSVVRPASTGSPPSSIGTPQPQQTTGYPVPTVTPRLGP